MSHEVTSLTVSVQTLRLNRRQITRGIVRQLDRVRPSAWVRFGELVPLGRVRTLELDSQRNKRFVLELLCAEPTGGLVKVCFTKQEWSEYESDPDRMVEWLEDPMQLTPLILAQ